jgi:dipeptidyl-peptidase-3
METIAPTERKYLLERVDEAAAVQLYADGFSALPLDQKILAWHLYQAAIAGRDIFYDQRYAHNLDMRDLLEAILTHVGPSKRMGPTYGTDSHMYVGPILPDGPDADDTNVGPILPDGPDADDTYVGPILLDGPESNLDGPESDALAEIERYTKLFWINTGPYNNLTAKKFVLRCSPDQFAALARKAAARGAKLPLRRGETIDDLLRRLQPMFFDPAVDPAVTTKTPTDGGDILAASANNLYAGVTMKDLNGIKERYQLNSRVVKRNGTIVEEVYRVGGLYDPQLREVIRHLEAAISYATERMATALRALIQWYRTGEEHHRREYDIAWVQDKTSPVDTINGFTEAYLDARGMKGAWEGVVWYINKTKTAAIQKLAADAQWFEDRMPWDRKYCKDRVEGITANVIDIVIETGDSGPVTPVGINLPNEQDVREKYGSKSVSLSNVNEAYERSTDPGFRTEFSWSADEVARAEQWQAFAQELTTDLHEVIGHASGKMSESLLCTPQTVLKEHYSTIEESRADLVALYFVADPKLVEMGIVRAEDHQDIVKAEYEHYARTPLVQLRRVREGSTIEEDHMRNRQMIVHWLMAHTRAIERRTRDGKTFYVMVDAVAFRQGVARLLANVQRIKAEGDYKAAKELIETYGVHFDPKLRDEIVARVDRLNLPSYTGFVQPRLEAVTAADGTIQDVKISYPLDLTNQMLEYAEFTRNSREQFRAS